MKTITRFVLSLAILVSAAVASGSEQRVKMADLPPVVQKTVREVSKGAMIRGFAKEVEKGKTVYEVEMTVNGHSKDISMDSAGTVLEVEEEVQLATIPYLPAVSDHFFVAYQEASWAAVGWDYRELEGHTAVEAEDVFEQGIQEFERFLKGSREDWLSEFPPGLWGVNHSVN